MAEPPGGRSARGAHHVTLALPDGRVIAADYRQPIVTVMRRHHKRATEDPHNRKGKGPGCPADLADLALIAEALQYTPEIFCPGPGGRCAHPPAEAAPYSPPPYRRPVTGEGHD